jgi:hypothetical protein
MARALALLALPLLVTRADAAPQCHVIDVDFTPIDQLQIVAWVETPTGTFVDTIFITKKTGMYGLGNRPGRWDFNSGPQVAELWPYGRRVSVFPVWAHRHGLTWPEVDFQDGNDDGLSHMFSQSSMETQPPYCRPLAPTESAWDTGTCPSLCYTDKGVFNQTTTSLYPPRADLARKVGTDSASVDMYKALNPFDAVTQATPPGGQATEITWPIPAGLPTGDYVMWLEVSRSFDYNDTYNATTYPPPNVSFAEYGMPYRGQPSVVYSVPFTIGTTQSSASTKAYIGYGDPTGDTGTLNPPDATITTDTPGTGASRLQIIAGSNGDRVRVTSHPEFDTIPPGNIADVASAQVSSSSAVVSFIAPGSDGQTGKVTGYEIRYRANSEITADNFADSMPAPTSVTPSPAGSLQTFEIDGLLPSTDYYVGIRAYDDCRNMSDVAVVHFLTEDRQSGEVDACFVATAAYGSLMANDVEMLRHFRDTMLRKTVFGELAIETYYTFGPTVAGVVGESDLLRATARSMLEPIVKTVRGLAY